MAEIVRLVSGFITWSSPTLVRFTDQQPTAHEMLITQVNMREDSINLHDEEVHKLYLQMTSDMHIFGKFEYREAIYKKAFQLFSEAGVFEWLRLQEKGTCFSHAHQQFLLQSLDYAYNRKARPISCSTYQLILQPLTDGTQFKAAEANSGIDHCSYSEAIRRLIDCSDESIIGNWVADIEGVQDLLLTLNVIFGRKPHRTTN